MVLSLNQLGKAYQDEWIFRGIDLQLAAPSSWAVLGPNGAGKSTLLRIMAGLSLPSTGSVSYTLADGRTLSTQEALSLCSFTAPYLELPEELSLASLLGFHFRFRRLLPALRTADLPRLLLLEGKSQQPVSRFSSGMKQRLKLGVAVLTDAPFVFLDEPLTNLDEAGVRWYRDLILTHTADRCVIVASNRPEEHDFCEREIRVADYK
jgi:ABC-type multidrug transport system ATPase subunit